MYDRPLDEVIAMGIKVLPQSLSEAIQALCNDQVIQEALGPIANEFVSLKTKEWETYDRQVTPWEIREYLTYF